MAKGDDSRSRNQIDQQGGFAQDNLNNLRQDTLVPQNQEFWNNYLQDRGADQADYSNVQGRMNEFADTGGYSDQDLGNIRSRALSPIRSAYSNAVRETDRQRSLQGGYSPNYTAARTRMAREQGQAASDATTNAEGMISQMVNEGKRFGASGLLSAYGTTPGRSNLSSGNALQSTQQRLSGEGLQQNLGLGLINAQIDAGRLPGKWEYGMSRFNDIAGIAKDFVNPLAEGLSGNSLPSSQIPGAGSMSPGGMTNQNASQGYPLSFGGGSFLPSQQGSQIFGSPGNVSNMNLSSQYPLPYDQQYMGAPSTGGISSPYYSNILMGAYGPGSVQNQNESQNYPLGGR